MRTGFAMIDYSPGLKISGSTAHETQVKKLLDDYIAPNPVGAVILGAIAEVSRSKNWSTTIVPYTAQSPGKHHDSKCQAVTKATNEDGAHPPGRKYPTDEKDDPSTWEREDLSKTNGTGTGTDSVVHFTPGMWSASVCRQFYAAQPDEALVHELFHALRQMKGLEYSAPLSGIPSLSGYGDSEEFISIVVSNVYVSAKCGCTTGLRADRLHSSVELTHPLNTSAGFLNVVDNLEHIFYFFWSDRDLFLSLAAVIGARFNPFREYVANIDKYLEVLF